MVAAVNTLCLLVLFSLAAVQYDAVLSRLVRDRLAVVAQALAEPFQAVADLGLSVDSLRDVDALLMRTMQSSPDVQGIYLFNHSGELVRSTEPVPLEDVAQAARAALGDADGSVWFGESASALLVASLVKSADGSIAGGILIASEDGGKSMQVQAMIGRLAFISGAILAISLALGLGILRFALKAHIHVFDALLATYDRFERQAWRGVRAEEISPEPVRGFGIDTAEMFDLLERSEERYQAENPTRVSASARGATLGT